MIINLVAHGKKRNLICIVIIILCNACSSQPSSVEISQNEPVPEFIKTITTHVASSNQPDRATRTVCIELNVPFLWKRGNQASDLNNHLLQNTLFEINNILIPADLSSFSLLSMNFVHNESGEVLGSYSDLTICYGIDHFGIGTYDATINTGTMSGEDYSYSFKIVI